MVSTRTQDGTIATKSYSPTTTRFSNLSLARPPASPTTSRHRPKSPTKIMKPPSSARAKKETPLRSPLTPAMINFDADNRSEFSRNAQIPPLPPSIRKRGTSRQEPGNKRQEGVGKDKGKEKVTVNEEIANEESEYVPIPGTSVSTFWPSVIIGAREEEGLSKIGRADKEVQQM